MKLIKLLLLITVMISLNIINIAEFEFKNMIFICISIILWMISIPNLKITSKTQKVLSIVFIGGLLIIGYFSVNWKYWYPLQMWWDTSWLYIPIILFIASKIINSNYLTERIKNNKKRLIITYIIAFAIVLGFINIIEKVTENISVDIIHSYLGIVTSILFIYQLYKFLKIKLYINVQNIVIITVELMIILLLNISEYQKINKYTVSVENINSIINSGELTYTNINDKFEKQIIEYHDPHEEFETYYSNRKFAFFSLEVEKIYSTIISFYKSSISNINKSDFDEKLSSYKEVSAISEDYVINTNKRYESFIIVNMLTTFLETIFFVYLSNRKNYNIN